jgi:hypothetical protein
MALCHEVGNGGYVGSHWPNAGARHISIPTAMKHVAKVIVDIIAIAAVGGIISCSRGVSRYERAFETTKEGELSSTVIGRFGSPSVREIPTHPYLVYASAGCKTPCALRVWWEHPVLKGIEAWSVEFDDKDRVIHKAHWVSP